MAVETPKMPQPQMMTRCFGAGDMARRRLSGWSFGEGGKWVSLPPLAFGRGAHLIAADPDRRATPSISDRLAISLTLNRRSHALGHPAIGSRGSRTRCWLISASGRVHVGCPGAMLRTLSEGESHLICRVDAKGICMCEPYGSERTVCVQA
jgi:hypothetical protein